MIAEAVIMFVYSSSSYMDHKGRDGSILCGYSGCF